VRGGPTPSRADTALTPTYRKPVRSGLPTSGRPPHATVGGLERKLAASDNSGAAEEVAKQEALVSTLPVGSESQPPGRAPADAHGTAVKAKPYRVDVA
jgi:hypothetical protein